MGSIVLTTLSIFLGLFFLFVGTLKVTPQVSREMHREIRRNYIQYSRVFPLAAKFGVKVSPKVYRLSVGIIEFFAGIALAFIPGGIKQWANVILLVLTVTALYTHVAIEDKFERTAPSIVFSLMLTCRLIILYQVRCRDAMMAETAEAEGAEEEQPVDTATEKKEN
ncbi:transmembrane protein 35-like protein [Leptotrombidium deliense]|uniref:Novel acetylcholine receptor chaperone n=1 Tax=Leptotrombidium deliense TaxID=299467 RepID=A0A443SS97_9ACAR|nr:transmembrane protein 35-like protein [Leptotrombidium deliense]